jgi:nucleotidyltransferase/DNA polymerase involved in DNA repair
MPAVSHCRARVATPPARLRDYVGRGVVTTATYEARALGVHSGMALMAAARLAPDGWRLPADFDACRRTSRRFKDAVCAIAPAIEDRGIDEICIDLTEVLPVGHAVAAEPVPGEAPDRALLLARAIKAAVRAATGLKLRFDNFRTVTRDHTRPEAARDAAVIRRAAGTCLKRIVLDRRIRLLGVRVGALVREAEAGSAQDRPAGSLTPSLFDRTFAATRRPRRRTVSGSRVAVRARG